LKEIELIPTTIYDIKVNSAMLDDANIAIDKMIKRWKAS
jgi:hypothetical protein